MTVLVVLVRTEDSDRGRQGAERSADGEMLIEAERQHQHWNDEDAAADADESAEDARRKSEYKNDRDFAHGRFVSSAHNFASVSERGRRIEDGRPRAASRSPRVRDRVLQWAARPTSQSPERAETLKKIMGLRQSP